MNIIKNIRKIKMINQKYQKEILLTIKFHQRKIIICHLIGNLVLFEEIKMMIKMIFLKVYQFKNITQLITIFQ